MNENNRTENRYTKPWLQRLRTARNWAIGLGTIALLYKGCGDVEQWLEKQPITRTDLYCNNCAHIGYAVHNDSVKVTSIVDGIPRIIGIVHKKNVNILEPDSMIHRETITFVGGYTTDQKVYANNPEVQRFTEINGVDILPKNRTEYDSLTALLK
jgi:hypothetical protein